jgi:hypothetical protein
VVADMKLKMVCLLVPLFILISVLPLFAVDCEIVSAKYFQRSQEVIATDWVAGIPYRKYKVENYPCADITFRNTFWQTLYSSDIEVTATFSDQSTKTKKIECGKKRLEPNEEFSCQICFEHDLQISKLECRFK